MSMRLAVRGIGGGQLKAQVGRTASVVHVRAKLQHMGGQPPAWQHLSRPTRLQARSHMYGYGQHHGHGDHGHSHGDGGPSPLWQPEANADPASFFQAPEPELPAVIYEVNMSIPASATADFQTWLDDHVQNVMTHRGFRSATVLTVGHWPV